ncbi:MAG: ABC transporter permease, partial [Bryobacteraceae bacterium]
MSGRISVEQLWQDTRYAVRTMRRSPGFTSVAVLSLALGIGGNTAIFSLIDTLMLRLLPVRDPQQLVEFSIQYPGDPPVNAFSLRSYEYYRDHNHVFSGLTGVHPSRFEVRGEGLEPQTVYGEGVVGNYFEMLGTKPAIGRLIGPQDDRAGAGSAVAVVSWSYWKSRFNLDPAILGKRIVVEDVPVTVIGVTPPEFFGLHVGIQPGIWVPLAAELMIHHRVLLGLGALQLIGRLRPGVSLEQARAEMAVLFRWSLEERTRASKDPMMRRLKFELEPAGAGLSTALRYRFAKPLLALMAVVGLLLLITCTNVASLLLARAAARQGEMALRVSLGAGPLRLVRQALAESLLLSGAGGLIGLWLAYFGADALVRIMMSGRPMIGPPIEIQVHPDARVLLFTAGAALLTGLLFGVAPARNAFACAPASPLREIGRAGETRFRRLFGKSLVIAQVAFSVILLSAASLFVRYLSNLEHLNLGFRRDHILLVTLDATHSGYKLEQLAGLYRELLARLEAIPGVRSATLCAPTPISGAGASRFANVEGHPERPEDRRYLSVVWAARKYFETLGIPLLAGREFGSKDEGRPRVAIVNQAMSRYYFPGGSPLGKHIIFDGDGKPYEIVGVVGDAKYYEIREAAPRTIYIDAFQDWHAPSRFVLRTAVTPSAIVPEVRRTARGLLKAVPIERVTTMAEQVDSSIVPERLIASLSGVFGALGSLLAAIGIYGLLAYTVARRINEIGIRMALGATRNTVIWMVLRDVLTMVCAGLAIGAPVAFWGNHFAAGLMQGLPARSAAPIAFAALAMIAVALLAAYLPARSAARVDPMEA